MTKDVGAGGVVGNETDHLLWQNSRSVTGAAHLKCLTSQHGLRLINPSEVNFMKNLKNLAAFIATAALATAAVAQNVDNWLSLLVKLSWTVWCKKSKASTWKSSSLWVTLTPSVLTLTTKNCLCVALKL